MEVAKQRKHSDYMEKDYFVTRHGTIINLSSAVRDSILPCKYVKLEIEAGNLILFPSNEKSEYKLSIGRDKPQAKICIFYVSSLIDIPSGVRLYATKREDGAIVIHIQDRA